MNTINQELISNLKEDGLCLIKSAVSNEQCDKVIADFKAYVNSLPNTDVLRTKSGLCSRLYNLQTALESVKSLTFNEAILDFLDQYFGQRTALNTSIFFEEGSQQAIHRDTPYFWSVPNEGQFVGVWFALEDVRLDNGPLEYYKGGHLLDIDRFRYQKGLSAWSKIKAKFKADFRAQIASKFWKEYNDDVERNCLNHGLEKSSVLVEKGDVIVWHANLPHGGGQIKSTGSTRYSMVCHYLPENSYVQPIDYFFGLTDKPKQIMTFDEDTCGRKMRKEDFPVFAPNE